MEFFDDIDIVDSVLSRLEFLRDPFLKKFKDGMLMCCEERFVDDIDDMEPGWHDEVSYRKGMIGCFTGNSGQRAGGHNVLRVEGFGSCSLFAQKQAAFEKGRSSFCLLVQWCLRRFLCLDGKQKCHGVDAYLYDF